MLPGSTTWLDPRKQELAVPEGEVSVDEADAQMHDILCIQFSTALHGLGCCCFKCPSIITAATQKKETVLRTHTSARVVKKSELESLSLTMGWHDKNEEAIAMEAEAFRG